MSTIVRIIYKILFFLSVGAFGLTGILAFVAPVPGVGMAAGIFLVIPGVVMLILAAILYGTHKLFLAERVTNVIATHKSGFFSESSIVVIICAVIITSLVLFAAM